MTGSVAAMVADACRGPGPTSGSGRVALYVNALLAILAPLPAIHLLVTTAQVNDVWPYPAGEWLLNDRGGLARRGLGGAVLNVLPGTQRDALLVLVGVLTVAVPALFAVLVHWAINARSTWQPLIWWFVPGGLLLAMWQGLWQPLPQAALLFGTRKEYLFYAWLLCLVLLVPRHLRSWQGILTFGLLLGAGCLIHEGLALLTCAGGAAHAVLIRSGKRYLLCVGAPVAAALVCVAAMPRPDAGLLWAGLDRPTQEWLQSRMPASFFAATFSPEAAVDLVRRQVLETGNWFGWMALAVVVLLWVAAATWLTDPDGTQHLLVSAGLLLPAAGLLAVVGSDWGRWIATSAVMTSIVVVAALGRMRTVSRRGRGDGIFALPLVGLALVLGVPETGDGAGGLLRSVVLSILG